MNPPWWAEAEAEANAIRRHIDLTRKCRGRDAQLFKFVFQDSTRMHGAFEHILPPFPIL